MKLKIISIGIILIITSNMIVLADNTANNESSDHYKWKQNNEDGFGKVFNNAPRGTAVFNDTFIIGVGNYKNDSSIVANTPYRLRYFIENLVTVIHGEGFNSDGCEIWAYNGTSWWPLVGNYTNALMPSGFGNKNNLEVGDLIVYKGYLYAGVRNHYDGCQIWRTRSINESWELVLKNGSGNLNNVWFTKFAIFKDQLYSGTQNYEDGLEMFRTDSGDKGDWECVIGKTANVKSGFGQETGSNHFAWAMEVYDGYLYLGIHGGQVQSGQIWRTENGVDWEPFIAYRNTLGAWLHGAKLPASFGLYATGAIRDMVVYKDELYVGTGAAHYLDVVVPFFGKLFTYSHRLQQLNPIKKMMTLGTNIWKYNSTADKWTKVIAGNGPDYTDGGFGDGLNVYSWDMKVYDDYLYVGTMHMEHNELIFSRNSFFNWSVMLQDNGGHGELWRYDGANWEPLVGKEKGLEFDDDYNIGIREIRGYKDDLLLATMNINTGCEVWKLNCLE